MNIEDNYWKDKNVLITGINGFVGSNIAIELIKKGCNRIVGVERDLVSNSNLKYSGADNKIILVKGSITDKELVERAVKQYEIDTVFHLAAQAIVTFANSSPSETFHSNIIGTANVLEAIRISPMVKRVVIASSDKAYGQQKQLPYTEESPLAPTFPYDVSKACAEMIAKTYCELYNCPITIVRPCNIYGGGDLNFNRIIPQSIKSILEDKNPVLRSDGSPVREYLYIDDVVDAYLEIAKNIEGRQLKGEVFNIGSDDIIDAKTLTEKMISASGKYLRPDIQGKGNPSGEIDKQFLSSDKLKNTLNWKTKVSLEEGLERTIKWYEKYFKTISDKNLVL